jgi:hypothetical protein
MPLLVLIQEPTGAKSANISANSGSSAKILYCVNQRFYGQIFKEERETVIAIE